MTSRRPPSTKQKQPQIPNPTPSILTRKRAATLAVGAGTNHPVPNPTLPPPSPPSPSKPVAHNQKSGPQTPLSSLPNNTLISHAPLAPQSPLFQNPNLSTPSSQPTFAQLLNSMETQPLNDATHTPDNSNPTTIVTSKSTPTTSAEETLLRRISSNDNNRSYAHVLGGETNLGFNLDYIAQPNTEKLFIPDEEIQNGFAYWSTTLVGSFYGIRPTFAAIQKFVKEQWTMVTTPHIMIMKQGWFYFRFLSKEDCVSILNGGPWMMGKHHLLLKEWTPTIRHDVEKCTIFPTWTYIYGLDPMFWTKEALSRIASKIGKPLFVDNVTASISRSHYAKVMIEVDVSKPLVLDLEVHSSFGLDKCYVEYEWLPHYCSHCSKIGHDMAHCWTLRKRNKQVISHPTPTTSHTTHNPSEPSHSLASQQPHLPTRNQKRHARRKFLRQTKQTQQSVPPPTHNPLATNSSLPPSHVNPPLPGPTLPPTEPSTSITDPLVAPDSASNRSLVPNVDGDTLLDFTSPNKFDVLMEENVEKMEGDVAPHMIS